MNSATAARLLDLNRRFYSERGRDFSDTRQRVQPGVGRILRSLNGNETILDLGCGNGSVARELARRGHRGEYLGVDSSGPLLSEARRVTYSFAVRFLEMDLAEAARARHAVQRTELTAAVSPERSAGSGTQLLEGRHWSRVTAFAFLHHIPGRELRNELLRLIRSLLGTEGMFLNSNWQFSANPRLQGRIQDWSEAELSEEDVDEGDYLMDWRRGGKALRYVHEFREDELAELAADSGFAVAETFYADGSNRTSGLYQIWRPV